MTAAVAEFVANAWNHRVKATGGNQLESWLLKMEQRGDQLLADRARGQHRVAQRHGDRFDPSLSTVVASIGAGPRKAR